MHPELINVCVVDKTDFSIRRWQVIKTHFFFLNRNFSLQLNAAKNILHVSDGIYKYIYTYVYIFFFRVREINSILNKMPI